MRILDMSLESSQMRNEIALQLKRLFLHAITSIIFLFFKSQIHKCFQDVTAGCISCKVHVIDGISNP